MAINGANTGVLIHSLETKASRGEGAVVGSEVESEKKVEPDKYRENIYGNVTTRGNGRPKSQHRSGEYKTGRDEKCLQNRQFQLCRGVKSDPGHNRKLKWESGILP